MGGWMGGWVGGWMTCLGDQGKDLGESLSDFRYREAAVEARDEEMGDFGDVLGNKGSGLGLLERGKVGGWVGG